MSIYIVQNGLLYSLFHESTLCPAGRVCTCNRGSRVRTAFAGRPDGRRRALHTKCDLDAAGQEHYVQEERLKRGKRLENKSTNREKEEWEGGT